MERWKVLAKRLVRSAESDFRLAKGYIGNASAASTLYEQAIKKSLKALFLRKNKALPPKDANVMYLAERTKLPNYIAEELSEMNEVVPEVEEVVYGIAQQDIQQNTLYKRDTAKRLLDYTVVMMH